MPPFSISGIGLKGFGCLRDRRGSTSAFLAKNLIYGFNGSGKTTLSRVFASLQNSGAASHLPAKASFDVQLSSGQCFKSSESFEALRNRVLVFNADFIEANLSWTGGHVAPVFYIGAEQSGVAANLQTASARTEGLVRDTVNAERAAAATSRELADHKRTAARAIEVELGQTRGYQAPQLEADYASEFTEDYKLTLERIEGLRSTIAQREAPQKLPLIGEFPNFADRLKQVREIANTTIGSLVAGDLQGHEAMLPWLKAGLEYHDQHSLGSCLFCMNELSAERKQTLAAAIDGKFKELVATIDELREDLETWEQEVVDLENSVPAARDVIEAHRDAFAGAVKDLSEKLKRMRGTGDHCRQLLQAKARNPTILVAQKLSSDEDLDAWSNSVTLALQETNAVIGRHNQAHDDFEVVKREARLLIKNHFLFEGQDEYRRLSKAATDAQQSVSHFRERQRLNKEEVERLQASLRQHALAVPIINGLIKAYLGHDDLQIAVLTEGYEIRRQGQNDIGRLSEGEKTAISLCYFISTLEAEQRRRSDLIVVIDDPISSLDTRALHYAFNLVKRSFDGVGQLFILTHNMYFMQEVKKWLKSDAYPGNKATAPTACLLYLDPIQRAGEESRSSELCELPKLIREYESEYQYLCHLIFKLVDSKNPDESHLLLIPNALRKILEIFLAFKDPGTSSIAQKIDGILAKGNYGIDPAKLHALERLAQVESHADNLDDLIGFSSMTVEESKNASVALLDIMKKVDPVHFERLSRVCRP